MARGCVHSTTGGRRGGFDQKNRSVCSFFRLTVPSFFLVDASHCEGGWWNVMGEGMMAWVVVLWGFGRDCFLEFQKNIF